MGEIQQVHDAEDDRDTQCQQRIDAAPAETVDEVLRQLGHDAASPESRGACTPTTGRPSSVATTDPTKVSNRSSC